MSKTPTLQGMVPFLGLPSKRICYFTARSECSWQPLVRAFRICLHVQAEATLFLGRWPSTVGTLGPVYFCPVQDSCDGKSLFWSSPLGWVGCNFVRSTSQSLLCPILLPSLFIFHRHCLYCIPNPNSVSASQGTRLTHRTPVKKAILHDSIG